MRQHLGADAELKLAIQTLPNDLRSTKVQILRPGKTSHNPVTRELAVASDSLRRTADMCLETGEAVIYTPCHTNIPSVVQDVSRIKQCQFPSQLIGPPSKVMASKVPVCITSVVIQHMPYMGQGWVGLSFLLIERK